MSNRWNTAYPGKARKLDTPDFAPPPPTPMPGMAPALPPPDPMLVGTEYHGPKSPRPPIGPGWSWRSERRRRNPWDYLATAIILGLAIALGFAVGRISAAAPRPATQQGSETPWSPADAATSASGWRTGAPPSTPGSTAARSEASAERPSDPPAPQRSGIATWYATGPGGFTAAAPGWRYGQTPYLVAVCAFHDGRSWCTTVTVQDFCACPGERIIDLSPLAFRALGWPLSRGVARVRVEVLR